MHDDRSTHHEPPQQRRSITGVNGRHQSIRNLSIRRGMSHLAGRRRPPNDPLVAAACADAVHRMLARGALLATRAGTGR
jgi:hypothetical protein